MMLLELPKKLSLKREEGHKIELEPRAKPLPIGIYKMTFPKLEE